MDWDRVEKALAELDKKRQPKKKELTIDKHKCSKEKNYGRCQ